MLLCNCTGCIDSAVDGSQCSPYQLIERLFISIGTSLMQSSKHLLRPCHFFILYAVTIESLQCMATVWVAALVPLASHSRCVAGSLRFSPRVPATSEPTALPSTCNPQGSCLGTEQSWCSLEAVAIRPACFLTLNQQSSGNSKTLFSAWFSSVVNNQTAMVMICFIPHCQPANSVAECLAYGVVFIDLP